MTEKLQELLLLMQSGYWNGQVFLFRDRVEATRSTRIKKAGGQPFLIIPEGFYIQKFCLTFLEMLI